MVCTDAFTSAGLEYSPSPFSFRETRPAKMLRAHGMVISRIVDPESAPTPIVICFFTVSISPRPEKRTDDEADDGFVPIAESGTDPKKGRTMLPMSPAHLGTRRRSSLPSEMSPAPLHRMKAYTKKRKTIWT